MKTQITQGQYNLTERHGQLVITLNNEIIIPENDPVRLLSAQLEELEYGKLYEVSPSQKSRHEKALKSGMRRSFSWVFKSAREASCESCAQAARAARAAAKAAGDSHPRAECGLTVL